MTSLDPTTLVAKPVSEPSPVALPNGGGAIPSADSRPSRGAEPLRQALAALADSTGWSMTLVESGPPADAVDPSEGVIVPVRLEEGAQGRIVARHGDASAQQRGRVEADRILSAIAALAVCWERQSELADQLAHRVAELKAVYQVSTALSGLGELQAILETALRLVMDVMGVKAGSIRLLKTGTDELVLRAWVNLSDRYFAKGAIFAHESELDVRALAGEVVYVEDLSADDRVRFPDLVQAEGLRSFLSTGLIFRGGPVGVIRLYTGQVRQFTEFDRNLLRAAAQQVATAIANARLLDEQRAAREVQRQVQLASKVQQRLLPAHAPTMHGLDVAARCLPSLQLGGDFYDFIKLGENLGVALGDVAGKGVPAALLMASVRASLRAHALDIYDLDEVMARTNRAMTQDTLDNEFATLWYGVIDTRSMRLTYCNAGHEPARVYRPDAHAHGGWSARDLRAGGPVIGVDAVARYDKGLFDLRSGDVVMVYSDGLCDAMNFDGERFGRHRIHEAMQAALAGKATDGTALGILNHLLWAVRRFIGLNQQSDDITAVVIRVTATGSGRR